VCRRLERLDHLRRYVRRSAAAQRPLTAQVSAAPDRHTGRWAASGASSRRGPAWPGHPVTATDLYQAGFRSLELLVTSLDVDLPSGRGANGQTIGAVPWRPRAVRVYRGRR
jgi:hypothetical protein